MGVIVLLEDLAGVLPDFLQDSGIGHNEVIGVVDLMGNSRHQESPRGHLVGLNQFGLDFPRLLAQANLHGRIPERAVGGLNPYAAKINKNVTIMVFNKLRFATNSDITYVAIRRWGCGAGNSTVVASFTRW